MDIFDDAERREQLLRDLAIEKAKTQPVNLAGELKCVKCGYSNDLYRQGFAVCSDCREELRNG